MGQIQMSAVHVAGMLSIAPHSAEHGKLDSEEVELTTEAFELSITPVTGEVKVVGARVVEVSQAATTSPMSAAKVALMVR